MLAGESPAVAGSPAADLEFCLPPPVVLPNPLVLFVAPNPPPEPKPPLVEVLLPNMPPLDVAAPAPNAGFAAPPKGEDVLLVVEPNPPKPPDVAVFPPKSDPLDEVLFAPKPPPVLPEPKPPKVLEELLLLEPKPNDMAVAEERQLAVCDEAGCALALPGSRDRAEPVL